jgi:hypothetical protein
VLIRSASSIGTAVDTATETMRVVSNTRLNMEVKLVGDFSGAPTQLPDLIYLTTDVNAGENPNIVHLAFAPNGDLFGIDSGQDTLVRFASTFELETVGPLGINISTVGGFDIARNTGAAYAALASPNQAGSHLYSINLQTGFAQDLGEIAGGETIAGFAVPEPSSIVLLGITLAAGISWRARQFARPRAAC